MKRKYLITCLLILFSFKNNIYAAVVNYENRCDNNKVVIGNANSCNGAIVNSKVTSTKTTTEDQVNTGKSISPGYDILLLIDNSGSMKDRPYDENSGTRQELVIDTVNNIKKIVSDYDKKNGKKSTIKYIFTEYPYNHPNNLYSNQTSEEFKYSLSGNTNLQGLWKAAYQHYEDTYQPNSVTCKMKNRIPIAIMITDGAPNFYTTNYGVTNSTVPDSKTFFSPIYSYYSMMTMLSLRDSICNLKIINFGIGMSGNDYLTKFMLAPTKENYDKLTDKETNISTASSVLDNIIKGNDVYDISGYLESGCDASPEYGMIGGKLQVNKKTKNKEIIYYTNFTNRFLQEWKAESGCGNDRYLSLNFPGIEKRDVSGVYYLSDNKWIEIEEYDTGTDNHTGMIYIEIYKNDLKLKDAEIKKIKQIKIKFKSGAEFETTTISNPLSENTINGISNIYSYVGSNTNDIQKILNENLITETEEKIEKVTKTVVNHSSCVNNNKISLTFYKQENEEIGKIKKTGIEHLNSKCGPVTISLETIMTEDIKIDIANTSEKTYAGGGFSWYNNDIAGAVALNNKIKWYYKHINKINNDKNPTFTVEYNYCKYNLEGCSTIDGNKKNYYWDLNDMKLYTDGSCKVELTNQKLDEKVWEKIKENVLDLDSGSGFTFNNKFTSIDSNNEKNTSSNVQLNNFDNGTDNKNKSLQNADKSSNSIFNVSYKASLPTAYINTKTGEISYQNKSKESDYINGGNLYYIPLKYVEEEASIKTYNQNFSVIRGKKVSYSAKCPVNIEQILYKCSTNTDCNSDNLSVAYKYRSIDNTNPFPKNIIPTNWNDYNEKYKQRLNDTYNENKLNYTYKFSSGKNSNLSEVDYSSWKSINSEGNSENISTDQRKGWTINESTTYYSYCPLGKIKGGNHNCES